MSEGFVYFIRPMDSDGPVKIGFSKDPDKRCVDLERSSPFVLEVASCIPGDRQLERRLHRHFRLNRLRGEWFSASDGLTAAIEAAKQGLSPLPELPSNMSKLIDRVGLDAIQAHFGISRQAVHYWRTKGVPPMHRKTLAMLGAIAGHSMPELADAERAA